jgi:hypothetical protein
MIDGSRLLFVTKNKIPRPHLGVMHLQGEWRECLEATMRAFTLCGLCMVVVETYLHYICILIATSRNSLVLVLKNTWNDEKIMLDSQDD